MLAYLEIFRELGIAGNHDRPAVIVNPDSASFFFTSGSVSASISSRLSVSTTSLGVPAGA
jgi:hypothetical protein